jgi:two-component system response regulator AtoC
MRQRILFIDDDPRIRELLSHCLEQHEFSVRTVGTSDEAMRIMDQMPFDLVILDVWLGAENGLNLLELLKLNHPNKPFIIYTGAAYNDDTVMKSKAKGAYACVSKSAPVDTIVSMIRSVLQHSD